jgi:hypothetical protein
MSGPDVDPELSALEESLGRLQPQAELSREAVLFEAGRAAAPRGRLWPAATGVSTLAAAVLGWLLWRQPLPAEAPPPRVVVVEKVVEKVVERVVHVPVPAPLEPEPQPGVVSHPVTDGFPERPGEYLRRRQEVLRWGVDILPAGPPQRPPGEPLTPALTPRLGKEL